jgi:hypothetical protein
MLALVGLFGFVPCGLRRTEMVADRFVLLQVG